MFIMPNIDLAEVVSVSPAAPMPGPPKKTDDKSFFDVSTYHTLMEKYTRFKYNQSSKKNTLTFQD